MSTATDTVSVETADVIGFPAAQPPGLPWGRGAFCRFRRGCALRAGRKILPGTDASRRSCARPAGRGAAVDRFALAYSVRRVGRSGRRPSADAYSVRAVVGRHVGLGVHSADGQDAHRRRLSDRHHFWILERMRGCLVLSRHSAGIVFVSAVAPGYGAGRLWRNRESCAGHLHAVTAICHC